MKFLFILFGVATLIFSSAYAADKATKTSVDTPGYDGSDLDIPSTSDLHAGSKRNPSANEPPYSDEETKKADSESAPAHNMPVDQD